ncbi:hypothetical protein [Sphaerisporangium fuscum]|uniref:hypothetical protein n=1 Tax=Sphaerisporangium fuscum TaxID=2835868 RepID=UPI001BDBF4A5|nr:hypothetical protein [Sphaerisporangium fuscum]
MSTPLKTAVLAAAVALGGLAVPATATTAHAAATSVSCDASGTTNFTPGVQLFPQSHQVSYRGDDRTCNDNSGMGIQSARITADFTGVELSCLASNFGAGAGSGTIEWTINGAKLKSRVDLTIDSSVLNKATVSGVVRSGPFEGQRFSGEFETNLLGGAGKCTFGAPFGGVKNAAFTGHYSIG